MDLKQDLQEIRELYPFKSNFLNVDGNSMHYVDEGEGEAILMLHGNPTWSFYYRDLLNAFKGSHRVIAPDYIGCGLSDKPNEYDYSLDRRILDLERLVLFLGLKRINLIVHDWGGAIGFGLATRCPHFVKSVVIFNTAAFLRNKIPLRISICRNRLFGDFLVRRLNAFAQAAIYMASAKGLSEKVKKAYLLPYSSPSQRRAISEFVRDIPMNQKHRSYATLKKIENSLEKLECPKLILWGGQDFCFNNDNFARWKNTYPDSYHKYYPKAGHYVLEDETEDVILNIRNFLEACL